MFKLPTSTIIRTELSEYIVPSLIFTELGRKKLLMQPTNNIRIN